MVRPLLLRGALAALLAPTLSGCGAEVFTSGEFEVTVDKREGRMDIRHLRGGLSDLRFAVGTGDVTITEAYGAYLFEDDSASLTEGAGFGRSEAFFNIYLVSLEDAQGDEIGQVTLTAATDAMHISWQPKDPSMDRLRISAECADDPHFMGLGAHAFDVDHAGEAFGLWVSEPGVGKSDTDEYPDDWSLTGTRHASSYPVPFLLQPELPQGLLAATSARVEVDLCASDPGRFSVTTWGGGDFYLLTGAEPVEVIETLSGMLGRVELAPPWAFGPWNDAARGAERIDEVAALLRDAGASSSVIWTEDWAGGVADDDGYRPSGEWDLDEALYPDAAGTAESLDALGFKWLAHFSPFVTVDTEAWADAEAAGVILQGEDGEPYVFERATLEEASLVDLTDEAGQSWAQEKMQAALELGFDGWLADFAERLPTDAVLASGDDPMLIHNDFPRIWQETHRALLSGQDAVWLARSGWAGSSGSASGVWAGDQRTSFDADDGLPTILPMGLGLAASGVPVYTHDVAGDRSVGNDPSDRELWYRWAALGAFSPIMRTNHGAAIDENWRFDSDEETVAYWAEMTRAHARLFPYRYGLAAQAAERGTPMVLPTGFVFDGEDWGRADAWMLGEALLVAPVLERGVAGREVDLPAGVRWFDWWTLEEVQSGWFDAATDQIPVFAAEGTVVPTLAEAPDTFAELPEDSAYTDLDDADGDRVVYVFGAGGDFTEADGTRYQVSGAPSGPAEVTETLTSGVVDVGGVAVEVTGDAERRYTFVLVD